MRKFRYRQKEASATASRSDASDRLLSCPVNQTAVPTSAQAIRAQTQQDEVLTEVERVGIVRKRLASPPLSERRVAADSQRVTFLYL